MPKFSRFLFLLATAFLFYSSAFAQSWPAPLLYQKNGVFGDFLGNSVAGAGDVNGDGKDDFIVGARFADPGGLSSAGSAYVYSGADGSLLYQKNGAAVGDELGSSVASAGDVNGDGRADFIIGADAADPGGNNGGGSIFVYSGADGSLLYQKNGTGELDALGGAVAGTGDVNGDSRADFIVGARGADPGGITSAGSAFVYSGADGSLLYQKDGISAVDLFGSRVDGAGDVNGDGRPDFIISALLADPGGILSAGSAYVYSGINGSLLYQKNGAAVDDRMGSVAGAGDVNGDGRADFIVGAFLADPGGLLDAGSAFVYSGADGSLLYQKNGVSLGENLGRQVAGVGDVNGDGKSEFIVGTPNASPNGLIGAGSAFVYSGADGSLLIRKNGSDAGDQFGFSVAGAGDVDTDGKADFIVGAPTAGPGGSAFLFHYGYELEIQSVSDISGDQGKQARLQWKSLPGNDNFVQQFAIYRRVDGVLTAGGGNDPFNLVNTPPGTWDFVTSIPATGDTLYTAIVPTLKDSSISQGMHWSVFFVSGLSENPTAYFDSPIDSGYSLDNLVPSAPSVLAAAGTCQGSVKLFYSNPVEPDFQYFKIYRDTTLTFSTPTLVGITIDTFFVDAVPVGMPFSYLVKAMDFSGNESVQSPQADAIAGLKGDLDSDASPTSTDVVMLLNAVFLGTPFPAPFCTGDLDCDLEPTSTDVVLELNLVFLGTPITCTP